MIENQQLPFSTGGSLVLDCEDGPITSVTSVTVYYADADDTSQALSATTGSASVDSTSTTLAQQADAQGVSLVLSSGTGTTVGRRYQLAGSDGLYELVDVVAKSSATITSRWPLQNTYASGATWKACRASISLDSTWAADLTYLSHAWSPNPRYRVKWVVVVNGETRVYARFFDLVRYPARHGVTPADVERRLPGFLHSLPTDNQADQGRSIIEAAWADVRLDLYRDAKAARSILSPEVLGELVIARLPLRRLDEQLDRGGTVDPAALDRAAKKYEHAYAGLIRESVIAVDVTGGGGQSTQNRRKALWER